MTREISCPTCRVPVQLEDSFCQECGSPLRNLPPPVVRTAPRPVEPLFPVPHPDEATRYLCASAHLHQSFAKFVTEQTIRQPHRAIHACPGIDLVALVRHAAKADERWQTKRGLMILIRVAAGLLLFLTAFPPSPSLPMAHHPVQWLLAVALMITVVPWTMLVVIYSLAIRDAVQVLGRRDPRTLAAGVGSGLEERLGDPGDSNVVVFSSLDSRRDPFTGKGARVGGWSITLDVSSHGGSADGARRLPFDSVDIHQWLARTVPDSALPDLTVRSELYVNGTHAPLVQGLVPDHGMAPVTWLDPDVVRTAARRPAQYARTYLCFEQLAWGGQLGLSYLVRAQLLQDTTLFLEGVARALFPLAPEFFQAATLPRDEGGQLARAVRMATQDRLGALPGPLGSRWTQRQSAAEPAIDATAAETVRSSGQAFDYGAQASIRTAVADSDQRWYFAEVDEQMHLQVLQRRIMAGIRDFLEHHGVDSADFRRQETRITNTINFGSVFNISSVSGSGNLFGDAGQVTTAAEERDGGPSQDGRPG